MSWAEDLLELYEKNNSKVGIIEYKVYKKKEKTERIPFVLLPPFHTTVIAQIEVTIDERGNFLRASQVDNEDKMTVIPVTEKSGSRTAGKEPHPLCDNLQYLAGDYGQYVKDESEAEVCYELYIQALEQWHLSSYTHKKVDAIYAYLKKRTLIKDLVKAKILVLGEDGTLDEMVKIKNMNQNKAFVRFVVRQRVSEQISEDACWKDRSLQACFIEYYRSMQGTKELDYLTGKQESPSYLHSRKIRNEGDGAKLISSNDDNGFTYRGRFTKKEQAFSIGSETSQKIHNALKWIIRKQGQSFDSLTIVVWESGSAVMPLWNVDTETVSSGIPETDSHEVSEKNETFLFIDEFAEEYMEDEKREYVSDENPITAEHFYQALNGYKKRVDNTSKMILMAFDAATTGRLALTEYKMLDTARYLENIEKWHMQCAWLHGKIKDGEKKWYYGVPGVKDIADILYGSETKGLLMINDKNKKRMYAEIGKRLIPCIWDGRDIPWDLVNLAVNRASAPQAYKEFYNWKRVLALACSFVKKYRFDKKKEEWNMALDKNCSDRNYLYGRLLAVADRIEYKTYLMENDAGRITNAKRYMSTFAQRPFETWKVIEENIQPYLSKLPAAERRYYENLIDSICQLFDVNSFLENQQLDGLYLLGFHSQSFDLRRYKKEEKGTEEK
ncbi:MAG: type I-C CRISPR-associated protein Cas8c/Csd1 [Lachnospiraceae bacterium]